MGRIGASKTFKGSLLPHVFSQAFSYAQTPSRLDDQRFLKAYLQKFLAFEDCYDMAFMAVASKLNVVGPKQFHLGDYQLKAEHIYYDGGHEDTFSYSLYQQLYTDEGLTLKPLIQTWWGHRHKSVFSLVEIPSTKAHLKLHYYPNREQQPFLSREYITLHNTDIIQGIETAINRMFKKRELEMK